MIEFILDWIILVNMVWIRHIDRQKYLSKGVKAEQGESTKKW